MKEQVSLAGLSPQERQVLNLSMSGLADKEVAAKLGLSLDTVKTYWKRIRQKVGAQTRPEIIALLLERGAKELLDEGRAEIQQLLAEVAQRKSAEDRFRAIAESLPVGLYVTDAQDEGVFVNQIWLDLAGMSRDEALHRGWSAAVHLLDKRRVMETWNKSKQSEGMFQDEHRYVKQDGQIGWLSLRAAAMHTDGQLIGYVRTVIDVTWEHEERDRLLAASGATSDLVFVLRANRGAEHEESLNEPLWFEFMNEGAMDYFGIQPGESDADGFLNLLQEESAQELRSIFTQVLSSGVAEERTIESPIDSDRRRMHYRVVPAPGGLVVAARFIEG